MSWLSDFSATAKPKISGKLPRLVLLQAAERKSEKAELLARGGEQEIALVALLVGGAVELPPRGAWLAPDIMAGRQRRGAQPRGRLQQVVKLDLLVAGYARDWRLALEIAVGERAHHRLGEPRLVVEHVMRDLEPVRDAARVLDILAGATGALAPDRLAMIVELKRDADDVVAFGLEQSRDHR